ncbi:MAG: serine protease [Nitriliruptoraceae bacterium]
MTEPHAGPSPADRPAEHGLPPHTDAGPRGTPGEDRRGEGSDAPRGDLRYPAPPEDLTGYRTRRMRVLSRFKLILGLLVAVAMIVPAGGWVLDRLAMRDAADDVLEALGEDVDLAASMRLVHSVDCLGRARSGSAFALEVAGETVLVTNRHVLEQARSSVVQPLDGSSGTAVRGIRLARSADVAVLEVDEAALPPPLERGPAARVGQPVISVGFPGARPTFREGRVDRVEPTRLVLGLEVAGGASGSPVMDEQGRVIGQVYARTSEGRGLATPIDLVAAAVDEAVPATPCG